MLIIMQEIQGGQMSPVERKAIETMPSGEFASMVRHIEQDLLGYRCRMRPLVQELERRGGKLDPDARRHVDALKALGLLPPIEPMLN